MATNSSLLPVKHHHPHSNLNKIKRILLNLKANFWVELSINRLLFELLTLGVIAYGFYRLGFRQ